MSVALHIGQKIGCQFPECSGNNHSKKKLDHGANSKKITNSNSSCAKRGKLPSYSWQHMFSVMPHVADFPWPGVKKLGAGVKN